MADKVKATVSHNQEIDGKSHEAGASVTIDAALARHLASQGRVRIEDAPQGTKTASAAADKKEAAK